jgi:hypothetical protein
VKFCHALFPPGLSKMCNAYKCRGIVKWLAELLYFRIRIESYYCKWFVNLFFM